MAHYAILDENNIVTAVIVGRNENEVVDGISDWEEYYSKFTGKTVKRTSYNTLENVHKQGGVPFRYNYAGIGSTFDPNKGLDGGFISVKPYASWILNQDNYAWEAPIPKPQDGKKYMWDEDSLSWIEVVLPE